MPKTKQQSKKHIPTWSFNDPGYKLPVEALTTKKHPFKPPKFKPAFPDNWRPPVEGLRLKGENTTFGVKKKQRRKKK